jgi:tRNA nucleotidyltransferase (CCA-adding enzyme)
MGIGIIVGHSNMDIDCFGSLVLARHIYPEYIPIVSSRIHPVAKNLYNIYKDHLNFVKIKEIDRTNIDHIVILDTRNMNRVKEYFSSIPEFNGKVTIYDHHSNEECDIPEAELISFDTGANTSLLCKQIREKNISLSEEEATIALAGVYADTGNFTHDNVMIEDFISAKFLLDNGANIKVVNKLLSKLKEEYQVSLFHNLLNSIEFITVNGHALCLSYMELDGQMGGLNAVVEQVFEVEDTEGMISVFYLKEEKSHLIIARSKKDSIDMSYILSYFGGGGHVQAASALIKKSADYPIYEHVKAVLKRRTNPAMTTKMIMKPVNCAKESWSLLDTSLQLEKDNTSGVPVLSDDGSLVGMITLRDIMKGRKHNQMHAPIKAYMTRNIITADTATTMREVESIFYRNDIGHLPILDGETLVGLVTRQDYVSYLHQEKS